MMSNNQIEGAIKDFINAAERLTSLTKCFYIDVSRGKAITAQVLPNDLCNLPGEYKIVTRESRTFPAELQKDLCGIIFYALLKDKDIDIREEGEVFPAATGEPAGVEGSNKVCLMV